MPPQSTLTLFYLQFTASHFHYRVAKYFYRDVFDENVNNAIRLRLFLPKVRPDLFLYLVKVSYTVFQHCQYY